MWKSSVWRMSDRRALLVHQQGPTSTHHFQAQNSHVLHELAQFILGTYDKTLEFSCDVSTRMKTSIICAGKASIPVLGAHLL